MKQENKLLNAKVLREKYGDAQVMGVSAEVVVGALKDRFTPVHKAILVTEHLKGHILKTPLIQKISASLTPKLRCEAELDPSFKQVIPYIVVMYQDKIFCTHRVGGDERLIGAYSIGIGGHIDEGETIHEGLTREVREEIGIEPNDWLGYVTKGYILDESTAVNAVHLGIVFFMVINKDDIACLESDKLTGEWKSLQELQELYKAKKLESWSEIVYEEILSKRM